MKLQFTIENGHNEVDLFKPAGLLYNIFCPLRGEGKEAAPVTLRGPPKKQGKKKCLISTTIRTRVRLHSSLCLFYLRHILEFKNFLQWRLKIDNWKFRNCIPDRYPVDKKAPTGYKNRVGM
jgi:hypothetical protein